MVEAMERHTKIIATMGPAVASPEQVRALVKAGMDVARLNFSHGDHNFHARFCEWVRAAAEAEGRVVAVLQDIQGPKLRVGILPNGASILKTGDELAVVPGQRTDEAGTVPIDYGYLLEDIEEGEEVLLADGLIRLLVTGRRPDRLLVKVTQGGELQTGKGCAFPDSVLRAPAITEKDEIDLEFGRTLGVDYVAASFVRNGEDIKQVRKLASVPVIGKIELASAYANLDDILSEAAGAMVARGDLGVQLPLERIPLIQADILQRTNKAGLVSITATEMLESMTHSPRPTRAEVTDVANAVAEGSDAVMLSAETATGRYPIETVEVMSRICLEVESGGLGGQHPEALGPRTFPTAIARAATEAAAELGIKTIVAFTETGSTPRLLSKFRPAARIIAFTPIETTLRRMALLWGVSPYMLARRDYTDVMFAAAEKHLEKEGICQRGEGVVMVAGTPPNVQASTNLVKLHTIGERDRGAKSQKSGRTSPEV